MGRANSFLRPKHMELEFYYYFIIDSVSLRKEPGVIQASPVEAEGETVVKKGKKERERGRKKNIIWLNRALLFCFLLYTTTYIYIYIYYTYSSASRARLFLDFSIWVLFTKTCILLTLLACPPPLPVRPLANELDCVNYESPERWTLLPLLSLCTVHST